MIAITEHPTLEWIKENKSRIDFDKLSEHDDMNYKWLEVNQDWNFKKLIKHKSFNFFWVNKTKFLDWPWDLLAKHDQFMIGWVLCTKHRPWDFNIISKHKNLNVHWLKQLKDKSWNLEILAKHKNFHPTWLQAIPRFQLNTQAMRSIQKSKTFKYIWIFDYPKIKWCKWDLPWVTTYELGIAMQKGERPSKKDMLKAIEQKKKRKISNDNHRRGWDKRQKQEQKMIEQKMSDEEYKNTLEYKEEMKWKEINEIRQKTLDKERNTN